MTGTGIIVADVMNMVEEFIRAGGHIYLRPMIPEDDDSITFLAIVERNAGGEWKQWRAADPEPNDALHAALTEALSGSSTTYSKQTPTRRIRRVPRKA